MVISARRTGPCASSLSTLFSLRAALGLAALCVAFTRALPAAADGPPPATTTSAAPVASASAPLAASAPPLVSASIEHTPLIAAPRRQPLRITASLRDTDRLVAAYVIYETESSGGQRQAIFRRSSLGEGWIAEIPSDHLGGDTLAYAIEGRVADGGAQPLFASRTDPQRVQLQDARADAAEANALERLGGRRSVVASSFEYVSFGRRTAGVDLPAAQGIVVKSPDRYVRAEAGYTYRVLRDVAEFGLRIGVVRGDSPGRDREVGLNYGAPHLRVRAAPFLHFEGSIFTGITEVGFAFGVGGSVHVGEPYGTKLVLGLETIEVFGTRGYSRLDVLAPLGLTLSPMVEITDMPHATATGVRLLLEASRPVAGGLTIAARGGYQARDEATGGPTLGIGAAYAF